MGIFSRKKQVEVAPVVENKPKEVTKTYNFNIVGLNHKNEDGQNCLKVLKEVVKDTFVGDAFMGMTQKECKEDYCTVEYYEGEYFDCEVVEYEFEGEAAVKIYILDLEQEKHHIGWISADKVETFCEMIKRDKCYYAIVVHGVKERSGFGTETKDWKPQVEVSYSQVIC